MSEHVLDVKENTSKIATYPDTRPSQGMVPTHFESMSRINEWKQNIVYFCAVIPCYSPHFKCRATMCPHVTLSATQLFNSTPFLLLFSHPLSLLLLLFPLTSSYSVSTPATSCPCLLSTLQHVFPVSPHARSHLFPESYFLSLITSFGSCFWFFCQSKLLHLWWGLCGVNLHSLCPLFKHIKCVCVCLRTCVWSI